jgi:hypothetical protein
MNLSAKQSFVMSQHPTWSRRKRPEADIVCGKWLEALNSKDTQLYRGARFPSAEPNTVQYLILTAEEQNPVGAFEAVRELTTRPIDRRLWP